TGQTAHRVGGADRDETIAADRQRLRDRERGIDRDDLAVVEDQVGGFAGSERPECARAGGENGAAENCGELLDGVKVHTPSPAQQSFRRETRPETRRL